MISLENKDNPDSKWNERLLQSELGTVYQTKDFAAAQTLIGGKPNFISFLNQNGKLVGQLLIISYLRSQRKGSFGKILGKISNTKSQSNIWVYGPVIFDNECSSEIIESLKNFLITKKWKISGSNHPLSNDSLSKIGKPFKIKEKATFLIDLSKGKEEVWKKMDNHSVRKNIGRSEARKVTIKKMEKSDFSTYLKIFEQSGKTTPFPSNEIAEKWWDTMDSVGHNGFLAYENETPIGGMAITSYNGYVNEFGIVRSKRDYSAKLYSQDLLKWKVIDWAISQKFRYYDLTGVTPNSTNEKELGIFRYKKKWGGKLMKYGLISL